MATRSFTTQMPIGANGANIPGCMIVTWTGLLNGDDGAPFVMPFKTEKSVQVLGTFGAGGSVTLEGTNQQTYTTVPGVVGSLTYAALNDPQGNALAIGAAKIEEIQEHVNAIRPRVTAGDGATDLTVVLIVTSAQQGF